MYPPSTIARLAALLFPLMLAGSACGSTNTPASSTTAPTPGATTTDSFSGNLTQQGTSSSQFTVTNPGSVQVELTSVGPLSTMSLGVSVASWDGTTCGTAIAKNDDARSGVTALSGTATAGNYCINVYDSGNVPADVSVAYTVQVTHP